VAAACLLATVLPAGASTLQRDFVVYLEDRRIGTHRFEVSTSQAGTTHVRSEASFAVTLLGLPAYRYHHQAAEAWRDGCLEELTAATDDNGRRLRVEARRDGGALRVSGGASRLLPGCVMSYAYWDKRMLEQPQLLNPQTGEMDRVIVEPLGEEVLDLPGRQVAARRYRLSSAQLRMDLWYSPQGEWLQLDSTTKHGKRLRYRLQ
jgi:Family of unknown function (DUF6134)